MKRIYVVRHAKSSWSDSRLSDIHRPLNERGKKDAPFMGKICASKGYIPDLLVSSNAKRASSTAKAFCKALGLDKSKLSYDKSLYHASEDAYINVCYGLDDKINAIMMFGHNPGITYLANSITLDYIDNVPTCGVLVIDATINSWRDLDFTNCKLKDFLYPKMF